MSLLVVLGTDKNLVQWPHVQLNVDNLEMTKLQAINQL